MGSIGVEPGGAQDVQSVIVRGSDPHGQRTGPDARCRISERCQEPGTVAGPTFGGENLPGNDLHGVGFGVGV